MRVFVTGATGFVGSAVIPELIAHGHKVLGLARSDAAAATVAKMSAEAHRGDLEDHAALQAGAKACDGVIHCAFIHDFSRMEASGQVDLRAIEAMGAALAGSDKPFITTSGMMLEAAGPLGVETDAASPSHRSSSEVATLALAQKGVRAAVMRLPPSVHGDGDHGFVPFIIQRAREKGVSAYVGDGLNLWPAVHRLDAAVLYRLVLEKGAGGVRYHAVGDEGVPFKDIAAVIGRRLNVPVASKTPEEAAAHFTWMVRFAGKNWPASAAVTRERLGWKPTRAGLIEDLDNPRYFGG